MSSNKIIPYEILYDCICTTKELIDGGPAKEELLILKSFLKHMKPVLERNLDDADRGAPIVGTHFAYPLELFCNFDVVPVIFEVITYTLSALLPEGVEKYYDISESWGHPYHTCSSQKGVLGMTLDDLFEFDVLATPSAPCDNSVASYPVIKNLYNNKYNKKTPLILADMPVYRDERSYKYFGNELLRVRDELGKAIGQEPDDEKLRNAVGLNNEYLRLIGEINELKRLKPSPIESIMCPLMTGVMAYMAGQPERVSFLDEVVNIGKERARRKERAHPGEEKIRAINPNMSIFFDFAFCEWLDRELGLNFLFDIFNYVFFERIDTSQSIEKIYEGLARQSMEYPMVRQSYDVDALLEDFVFMSREFDADCAIFASHLGCKQFHALLQLLREALRDELGIPMLTIDLDVGDKRYTSIQTIKKEIETFVNTLL